MSIQRARKGGRPDQKGEGPIYDWLDRQYAKPSRSQAAPAAKTVTAIMTAAEMLNGMITGNQGGAAAAVYQLPLGTAIETAFAAAMGHGLEANDSFDFNVINISTVAAEVLSLTANTGVTVVGDMTMAAVAVGDTSSGAFRCRRVSNGVYVVYRLS